MHEPLIVTGIQNAPLDVQALTNSIRRDDCGALVTFEGGVRTPNNGHDIVELFYEAYEELARRQLIELANTAVERFSLGGVVAVHRTGSVNPGEPAVLVVTAAAHRTEAFAATSWLIDTIKSEVAIWKKELSATDEQWVGIDINDDPLA